MTKKTFAALVAFLMIARSPGVQASQSSPFFNDPYTFSQLPEITQLAKTFLDSESVLAVPIVQNVGANYRFESNAAIPGMTGIKMSAPGQVGYSTIILFMPKSDLAFPAQHRAALLIWPDRMKAAFAEASLQTLAGDRYILKAMNSYKLKPIIVEGSTSQLLRSANLARLTYEGTEFMYPADVRPVFPKPAAFRCESLFSTN